MALTKIGALWEATDKRGRPFLSGVIDADVSLAKGGKVFVFKTDPAKRKSDSPVATISINVNNGSYQAKPSVEPVPEPDEPVAEPEPMPPPLPDEDDGSGVPF